MPRNPSRDLSVTTFGHNEWLVDALYQQYTDDPGSVDPAWWDFFADYEPRDLRPEAEAEPPSPAAPAPAAPPASPAPAPPVNGSRRPAPARREEARQDRGTAADGSLHRLRGPAARVVGNMESSLQVPTATSVRAVPAKLLIENRIVINNSLARTRGGKVSVTHLLAHAIVRALTSMPEMNNRYAQDGDAPAVFSPDHVNLGIAVDLAKDDGTRQLLVPNIPAAQTLDFARFRAAYEDVIRRARTGKLTVEDFRGTTITLTNPGTLGTHHSVPRLMAGQGTIVGVGAMEFPAEYAGASQETLARLGISKTITLTSTYDHRIIQGATSGEFLRRVQELLLGEQGFYDDVFRSLGVPYEPLRWVRDLTVSHEDEINKTARVQELIQAYRVRGHLLADTNPVEYRQRRHHDLELSTHGLTLWDLDRRFPTGRFGGTPVMSLREVLTSLRDAYCATVGVEYMHIQDPERRSWVQERVETPAPPPTREEQLRILRRLNAAEAFETFLQTKYVGQRRFSLEGGESVVPLLDALLNAAALAGVDEVCIGMPHRGRLNVLANIAGKSYGQIFREFEGTTLPGSVQGSGDVKYHLGTDGVFTAVTGEQTRIHLAANPSHLEAVNPVLEGIARAKQDRLDRGSSFFPVLPILLHGDAAFAGQGVVAETLNLSQLRGYRTGGTVHVVINNQLGFTTAPMASRSSVYCTDIARMIQAPIFHVNGDDPEACVRVARLAFEYRMAFDSDAVIDVVCYRRRGHNEGDDPSMTQPQMYRRIEDKRSVRKLYTTALIARGDITLAEAEKALQDYQHRLERAFVETRDTPQEPQGTADASKGSEPATSADPVPAAGSVPAPALAASPVPGGSSDEPVAGEPEARQAAGERETAVRDRPPGEVPTAVDAEVLRRIGEAHRDVPEGFTPHPKLRPLLERRATMAVEGSVDWAFAELLALGSLLDEGVCVRLAGQDSRRGTFVQRHAVLVDHVTGQEWTPLAHLSPGQGRFWIYDSLLSEFAAMGFEYGYSVARPDALVLWEAQFGDFADGAQTIVDEFVSSSEQKWGQRSSVVLLLPHGLEGQGPDHSSGRIERYLQLCAQDNLTVAVPSTPASHFHLLRRQARMRPRRPLVVFTPKSMLRMKAAVSPLDAFTSGGFAPVLVQTPPQEGIVERVLLCSGRLAHDLVAEKRRRGDTSTAVVTLEQLYPLPTEALVEALRPFPDARLAWVQDEPANQGAWSFLRAGWLDTIAERLVDRPLRGVTRPASASPATGSARRHQEEQAALFAQAFAV